MGIFESILKDIKKDVTKDRVIAKRITLTDEEKAMWEELERLFEEEIAIGRKRKTKRDLFWATVANRSGEHRDMHFDSESGEVWVYEDEEE